MSDSEKIDVEIVCAIRYTKRKWGVKALGEVISVISGKGGTGKTTVCAAVATCMAANGTRVLCIDADIGLRNLDIALGMAEQPIVAFTDVLHGHYGIDAAAVHPRLENLFLFTAPIRETDTLIDMAQFGKLLEQARERFDCCLIDAPAGIGRGFRLATHDADRFIVVSTPDPASMRDAGCTADLLLLDGKEEQMLVVNRVAPRLFSRMALTVDDIMDEVGLPLLGLVPEDADVMLAAAEGSPLIFATEKRNGAAEACLRISRRLCGEILPLMKF